MWIIEEEASHYRRKQPEGDESQMMNKTYLPMSEEKLEVWAINQRLPPPPKKKVQICSSKEPSGKVYSLLLRVEFLFYL